MTSTELTEATQPARLSDGQMIYLQRTGDDDHLAVAGPVASYRGDYGVSDAGPLLADAWTYQAARWAAGCGPDLDRALPPPAGGLRPGLRAVPPAVLVEKVLEAMDHLPSGHCRTSYARKPLPREDMARMDGPDTVVSSADAAPGVGIITHS